MIKKINKIKNFGIFDNYHTDSDLLDFKKYNLIYGWNGSGKTTLSRLLRCFELKKLHRDFPQAEFKIQIKNGSLLSHKDLNKISNIRVFNQDFIEENVFTPENTIQPIYYLGKEDIEQKKKLEILKNKEAEKTAQLNSENQNLKDKKKAKEKFITEQAQQIKRSLRTTGTDIYTNYDKSKFFRNIESLNKEEINQSVLNEEELNKRKKAIYQNVKNNIQTLEDQNYFKEEDIEEINKILKTEISSETIEKLKNNKNINKWVKEGLDLYNQSNKGDCHFCEQLMPENRIETLKKHFSQDYEHLMKNIDALKEDWGIKKIEISIPDKNALYEDLSQNFQEKKNKLNKEVKRYNQFIETVLKQLKKKKENPFKNAERVHYESFQIKGLIDKLNKIIFQHNEKTKNFNKERLEEKKNIEKHYLSESYREYQSFKNEIKNLEEFIKNLKLENISMANKIKEIFHQRRGYKQTAENLNNKLESFLGRKELTFEATKTKETRGYYIKRSSTGTFAKSLSEGEKTAVALVYFLSKLKEDNFDLQRGIVVMDDPISSLDSNAIHQAFGFIKTEVKKVEQVFILTHNFDFFKHIKNWFKRDYKEKTGFFMMKNFYKEEKRETKIIVLDDLLQKYDSEYQYLFKLLYISQNRDLLEEFYLLPNVARKFLEIFLSFKFPSEKIYDGFFSKARKQTNFDDGRIEKIKRFINAHSHSDIDEITGWDVSSWSEGRQVIKDILELVKKLDEEHYKDLCKLSLKPRVEKSKAA